MSSGFGWRGEVQRRGGTEGLSAQRGVNFSVIVPFWFCFFFFLWKVGVGLVGVVALCGGVDLVGEGRKTVRMKGSWSVGGGYPQEETKKRDLLSSFALDPRAHNT